MATQAQQPGQMSMPLQNEMQLANWISGMVSGKSPNPNYTGATVQAPQLVNQMAPQDLQNLMTEYMRGQGGFLNNMMQSRQSGLYNSNTRNLVSNDILAQAALKASQANVPIQQGNAQLMNQYYSKQQAIQPKYLPNNSKNDALGGLAIAGIQKLLSGGLGSFLGGGLKTPGKKGSGSQTSMDEEGAYDSGNPLGVALEAAATGFLGGGLNGALGGETADSFGTGISLPSFSEGGGSFDLGSSSGFDLGGITDFVSNISMPDFDIPSFDLGDFDISGAFDFLDVGSWFD